MVLYVWLVPLLLWLFVVGAAVGSFLNVCIYRLTAGKSLIWPGSRCGHCRHEVRLKDNIPLVSYWVLGGRCRDCGAPFAMRYFWVELLTALTFVTLYLLEIGLNVQHQTVWPLGGFSYFEWARFPPHSWELFIFHAILACLLIAATGCLLESGRVPTTLAVVATLVGLAGAVVFPWPYPEEAAAPFRQPPAPAFSAGPVPSMPTDESWAQAPVSPGPGFYPWPVWGPLPRELAAGRWPLGLLTGAAGALLGGWGLRLVGQVAGAFAGREVLSTGAADLAMIAGAFLGWQPVLVAILLALAIGLPLYVQFRRPRLGGLVLVLAIIVSWLGWGWIGPVVRPVLFDPLRLLVLGGAVVTVVAVEGLLLRAAEGSERRSPPR